MRVVAGPLVRGAAAISSRSKGTVRFRRGNTAAVEVDTGRGDFARAGQTGTFKGAFCCGAPPARLAFKGRDQCLPDAFIPTRRVGHAPRTECPLFSRQPPRRCLPAWSGKN